jgi:hypothetical protein
MHPYALAARRPSARPWSPPERVRLSHRRDEEIVETLYLLGEQDRSVGISGCCVRLPEARRDKAWIVSFTAADNPTMSNGTQATTDFGHGVIAGTADRRRPKPIASAGINATGDRRPSLDPPRGQVENALVDDALATGDNKGPACDLRCPGCQASTASFSGSSRSISANRVAASAYPARRSSATATLISWLLSGSSGCVSVPWVAKVTVDANATNPAANPGNKLDILQRIGALASCRTVQPIASTVATMISG